jgi:hypothetical protein
LLGELDVSEQLARSELLVRRVVAYADHSGDLSAAWTVV